MKPWIRDVIRIELDKRTLHYFICIRIFYNTQFYWHVELRCYRISTLLKQTK